MSEQKQAFMKQLDQWSARVVIEPIFNLGVEYGDAKVKQAIREKVLESYHNGRAAASRKQR